jgi:hypothetical protein
VIEVTGNIVVHHPEREDRNAIDAHTRALINRLIQDQNNPEGDL